MSLYSTNPLETVNSTLDDKIFKGVDSLPDVDDKDDPMFQMLDSVLSEEKLRSHRFPSYTEMIATAILSGEPTAKSLQDIYMLMQKRYPFLEHRGRSWKNSVRHTLSFNECFVKIPRQDSGQRCNWTVHEKYVCRFLSGNFKNSKVSVKYRSRREKRTAEGEKRTEEGEKRTAEGEKRTAAECSNVRNIHAAFMYPQSNRMSTAQQLHFPWANEYHCGQLLNPYFSFQGQQRTAIQEHAASQKRLRHFSHQSEYNWPEDRNFSCYEAIHQEHLKLHSDFFKFCIKLLNEEINKH